MMVTSTWKRILCVVALVGSCAGANANTTTDLGALSAGPPIPFSGTVIPSGVFTDIFTFTLPANGGSGYSVVNFPLDIPGVANFNTVFSSLMLVSNPDGVVGTSDDLLLTSAVSAGGANSLSFPWGPTSGGSMYLAVGGLANGTTGGLYNGAISISAIPEPAVWFLIASGIGLIGFLKLRGRDGVVSL